MRIDPNKPHDGEVWCVVPADYRSPALGVFTTRAEAVAALAARPDCHAYHFDRYEPGRTLTPGSHDRGVEVEAAGLRRTTGGGQ
jgi:hypothetical protein